MTHEPVVAARPSGRGHLEHRAHCGGCDWVGPPRAELRAAMNDGREHASSTPERTASAATA